MRNLFTGGADIAEELQKDENAHIMDHAKRIYHSPEGGNKAAALFVKTFFEDYTLMNTRKAIHIIMESETIRKK